MKIPFDIKYRPQIELGEYKVVTRDNAPVRIVCWDANAIQPIIGLVLVYDSDGERETIGTFFDDGCWKLEKGDSIFDLFIITPEPELTEFEKGIKRGFLCAGLENVPTGIIKDTAQELMTIAKKELYNDCTAYLDGYCKGRQDALKEMEENRVYKHEGPYMPVYWPCHYGGECTNPYGGECTNPFRDCINCHRQSTDRCNTTTGTSAAKVEGKE